MVLFKIYNLYIKTKVNFFVGIRCVLPDLQPNTELEQLGTDLDISPFDGEIVSYQCAFGFERQSGTHFRLCQANGTLNGTDLICGGRLIIKQIKQH